LVAAAALVDPAGRVLLSRRPDHAHQGGLWEFPGGKIEPGEDPVAALRREIREEFGTEIVVGAGLTAVDHDYGDFRIRLHPFLARLAGGGPVANEHADWVWTDAAGARALDWAPADLPVLEEVGQRQKAEMNDE